MNINIPVGESTTQGLLHLANNSSDAVILVSGAGGGLFGPGGIYTDLGKKLARRGITALQLDHRTPNKISLCVEDIDAAITHLVQNHHVKHVSLVGWSFGGAVVITAGALSKYVVAVATIASQTAGTELVSTLAPKPLLLLHGTGDTTLTDKCSRILYQHANDPKEIVLYPNDNHTLAQNSKNVIEKLTKWSEDVHKMACNAA
jgi:dienelactone hydrolase